MRKFLIIALAAVGLLACKDKNEPSNKYPGMLSGKFSVSAKTKVHFSQGNLQYQASTNTWQFAENQYDTIGALNTNISSTYDGWIDLFGCGTGNNPTLASTDDSDYSTFTDWGANVISNGGQKANAWRTLTLDEWKYLCQTRTNAENLRGSATVAGVRGYVFLPDNWTTPDSLSWQGSPTSWTTNQYSADEWSTMQANGAVFLPAAGAREGVQVKNVSTYGEYWSSTLEGDDWAFYIYFSWKNWGDVDVNRYYGFSVRLVR